MRLPYPLEAELTASELLAVEGLDDATRLALRDGQEREALEHHDVANGLAVEARGRRDRRDDVGDAQACCFAAAEYELDVLLTGVVARDVRLGVPARALADRGRRRDGALLPLCDGGADVTFDRLELALLAILDERDRAA